MNENGASAQGGVLYQNLPNLFGGFLAQRAFACTSYRYDQSGGSELIEFQSERLKLRLLSDHGQFFADVGLIGPDTEWFQVQDLLELLAIPDSARASALNEIAAFAGLLQKHFAPMLELLGLQNRDATRERIDVLRRTRIARLLSTSILQ